MLECQRVDCPPTIWETRKLNAILMCNYYLLFISKTICRKHICLVLLFIAHTNASIPTHKHKYELLENWGYFKVYMQTKTVLSIWYFWKCNIGTWVHLWFTHTWFPPSKFYKKSLLLRKTPKTKTSVYSRFILIQHMALSKCLPKPYPH